MLGSVTILEADLTSEGRSWGETEEGLRFLMGGKIPELPYRNYLLALICPLLETPGREVGKNKRCGDSSERTFNITMSSRRVASREEPGNEQRKGV